MDDADIGGLKPVTQEKDVCFSSLRRNKIKYMRANVQIICIEDIDEICEIGSSSRI